MTITRFCFLSVLSFFLFSAITAQADEKTMMMPMAAKAAVAVLIPTVGNTVTGTVCFTQVDGGVRIVADVSGLKPGAHGFHIHEFGDITSTDGMSVGGHFNPSHSKHGGPGSAERHEGDLGNLNADENGHARSDYVDAVISLDGPTSIIGRGVVVHADADDLKSQPVGNAGKRVAIGVIGVAKR